MELAPLIAAYCAAWSESDARRREQLLRDVWSDDGMYVDPTARIVGRSALVDHIGKVLARYPGARVVTTSALDAHHDVVRFAWKMVLARGESLPEGIDVGEVSGDGKLKRIVGFFGPLARN